MSLYPDDGDDHRRRSSSHGRGHHHRGSSSQEDVYDAGAADPDARYDSLHVPSTRRRDSAGGRSDVSVSRRSGRSPSRERSRDRSDGSHSPLGKARHAADKAFSSSTTGIGVGVLGAIVGGFAAREASEAAARARDKHDGRGHHSTKSSKDHDRATLISTIVGAAVGGLGANAIEKRIEHRRHRKDRDGDRDGGRDRDRDRDRDYGRDYDSEYESGSDSGSGRASGRPRELEYRDTAAAAAAAGSRSLRARSTTRGGVDSDSDAADYELASGGRSRRTRDRNLVISRSPSRSTSRSPSRSTSRSRLPRPQHGGAADAYYSAART